MRIALRLALRLALRRHLVLAAAIAAAFAVPGIVAANANAVTGADDDRARFLGVWGTDRQCAGAPIKPGGTVLAEPFHIGEDWLRHGPVWCRLTWFPVERRADGLFTGAYAQCGEDSVRDFLLRLELSGETLTLRWGLTLSNGPLAGCPGA